MKTVGNFTFWFKEQEFSEENFYRTIEGKVVKIYVDNLKIIAEDAR